MLVFVPSDVYFLVTIFVTDEWTQATYIEIIAYCDEIPDATITALSQGLILLAVIVMIIGDRLVGLRRLADF